MKLLTLAALKQSFADALSGAAVDLADLALLASEILAVSSDPASAETAQAARRRGREQLDELIEQCRRSGAGDTVAAFVDHLGSAGASGLGFAGNAKNYYSADNSNLGWVLATRRGIPITLAIVYIEVGRGLGFDLRGIAFPGHFLVGVHSKDEAAEPTIIDPFAGKFVSRAECMQMLARMRGPATGSHQNDLTVKPELFVAGEPRQIILRLLENLKQIHVRDRAAGPVLAALELQLLVAPESFELRAAHDALVKQMFGHRPGAGDGPEVH